MNSENTQFPVPDPHLAPLDPYVVRSQLSERIDNLSEEVEGVEDDVEALDRALDAKQDTLIAGENITIVNNVISATGGGGGAVAVQRVNRSLELVPKYVEVQFADSQSQEVSVNMLPAGPLRPPVDNYDGSYQYNDYWLDAVGGCGLFFNPTHNQGSPFYAYDMSPSESGMPAQGWSLHCSEHGLVVGEGASAIMLGGSAHLSCDVEYNCTDVADLTFPNGRSGMIAGAMPGGFPIEVLIGQVELEGDSPYLPAAALDMEYYDPDETYQVYGHLYAPGSPGVSANAIVDNVHIRWTRYRFEPLTLGSSGDESHVFNLYAEGWVALTQDVMTTDADPNETLPSKATFQPRAVSNSYSTHTFHFDLVAGMIPHQLPSSN